MSSPRPAFDQAARIEMIKKTATTLAEHYKEKELARTGGTLGEAVRAIPLFGPYVGATIKRNILPALVAIQSANSFIDVLKALAEPSTAADLITAIKTVDPKAANAAYTENDKTHALNALETHQKEAANTEGVFTKIIYALRSILDTNKDAAAIAKLIRGLIFSGDAKAEATAKAKTVETADDKITHAYLQLLNDLDALVKQQLNADTTVAAPAPVTPDMKSDAPAAEAIPATPKPAAPAQANPATTVAVVVPEVEATMARLRTGVVPSGDTRVVLAAPATTPLTPAASAPKKTNVALGEALVDSMVREMLSNAVRNATAAKTSTITLSLDAETQTEAATPEIKMTAARAAEIGRDQAGQAMALAAAKLDAELLRARTLQAETIQHKQAAELKALIEENRKLRALDRTHTETEARMGRQNSKLGMVTYELATLKKEYAKQLAALQKQISQLTKERDVALTQFNGLETTHNQSVAHIQEQDHQIQMMIDASTRDAELQTAQLQALDDEHTKAMATQKAEMEAAHNEQLARANKTITDLNQQLAAQRRASATQLAELTVRIQKLEGRVAEHTDSSESDSDNESSLRFEGSAAVAVKAARASLIGFNGSRQHLQAANAATGGAGPNADAAAAATAGSPLQKKRN